MQAIAKGKEKAFDELYHRYSQRMYHYFYRMLYQNREKAEDFTQDLFLKIVARPEMFDTKRKFSTWIYTVAGNMCKNEYRRNKNRQTSMLPEKDEDIPMPSNSKGSLYLPNAIDKELFDQHLLNAINELDEIPRQCFILRYQEELSIKEISAIVDCPEGTVKSRIHYTLKKLSVKLKIFDHQQGEKKVLTKRR